jgi:hypothetical protein
MHGQCKFFLSLETHHSSSKILLIFSASFVSHPCSSCSSLSPSLLYFTLLSLLSSTLSPLRSTPFSLITNHSSLTHILSCKVVADIFQDLVHPREVRILMLGLDGSGKTTILYKLKLGEVLLAVPTIGFNIETVEFRGLIWNVWDIGGQSRVRRLWKYYVSLLTHSLTRSLLLPHTLILLSHLILSLSLSLSSLSSLFRSLSSLLVFSSFFHLLIPPSLS